LKYIDKYFNENDHIFDKRRQEKTSSAFLILNFNNLFNSKNIYATLLSGISNKFSNIAFYREEKLFAGFIVGYKF
jgi:hypothetical protein